MSTLALAMTGIRTMTETPQLSREELVEKFYRDVFGTAYRFAGNEDDASDLTQETFKNVFNAMASGSRLENPKAYLITTLKNVFFRRIHDRKRESAVEDIEGYINSRQMDDLPKADTVDSKVLQQSINRLDEHFRVPLVLYYYNECSYEDIAKIMNIPIGTVMSRLSRAKRFLKLALSGERQQDD